MGMGLSFYYHSNIAWKINKMRNKGISSIDVHNLLAERKMLIKTNPELGNYHRKFLAGISLLLLGVFMQITYWIIISE